MANTNDPSLVNFVRPEAIKVRPDLDLMADFVAGTRQVQDNATPKKYLRKWKDEDQSVFDIRRTCESVFEGLGRVLSASVGMLFAKPPVMEWENAEAAFAEDWENLDGMGTAGPVLAKRFAEQSVRDGLGLILVDHPQAPEGVVVTAANEQALGLRPTWALYPRASVCSWRTAMIGGGMTVTQLVLEECTRDAAGTYGVMDVRRYRVLKLSPATAGGWIATWELWRETKDTGAGGFALESAGTFRNRAGEAAERIPIAIAYTGRTDAPLCASLPLLGVAWANLSHWRLSTALTFAREVASYAQGVIVGELAPGPMGANGVAQPGKVKLGPLALIHLVGENASFEWKAPPVEAFDALERGIQEKLEQMGAMGMAFLAPQKKTQETFGAKRLDAAAEHATLATAAEGVEDALNTALAIHAWYRGIDAEGAPEITINKDFNSELLDAQTMTAYIAAVKDAGLPVMSLLEAWQKGGRIPEDTDLEELAATMEATAKANADAEAAAQADALAMANAGKQMPPKGEERMAA